MKISVTPDRPILSPCSLNTFEYQMDPYVGCEHYCYYCYALNQAKTDWSSEVLIHKDLTARLNEELSRIRPQTIYMGWQTDPYQPCEAEYQQTRQVLELLLEKGFSASILTKSDLFLRDVDVLKNMPSASVSISVAFNDDMVRRRFEAGTIDTSDRIEALLQVRKEGIRTSALICPVIPYITDAVSLMDMLAPCTDAIWIYGLSILNRLDQNWKNVERILENHFPDLRKQIETVTFAKDHIYWTRLRQDLMEMKKDRQLDLNIHL